MFTRGQTETVPNRTGPASVYMEPFGTDPGVYMGPFWNQSGADPNGSKCFAGPVLDPFRSRINRRPIRSDFRTGSIWNRSRVNIAIDCQRNLLVHILPIWAACGVISSCLAERCYQNAEFFRLKYQLELKNVDTACLKSLNLRRNG